MSYTSFIASLVLQSTFVAVTVQSNGHLNILNLISQKQQINKELI